MPNGKVDGLPVGLKLERCTLLRPSAAVSILSSQNVCMCVNIPLCLFFCMNQRMNEYHDSRACAAVLLCVRTMQHDEHSHSHTFGAHIHIHSLFIDVLFTVSRPKTY
jgi:hypothetical protein